MHVCHLSDFLASFKVFSFYSFAKRGDKVHSVIVFYNWWKSSNLENCILKWLYFFKHNPCEPILFIILSISFHHKNFLFKDCIWLSVNVQEYKYMTYCIGIKIIYNLQCSFVCKYIVRLDFQWHLKVPPYSSSDIYFK